MAIVRQVHPIERLRYVARGAAIEQRVLLREAASALGGLDGEEGSLVLSCKRLLDRQPTAGPLWWLCARLLCAGEIRPEAWRCADEIEQDPTPRHLIDLLPDDASVLVLGWPELVADALPARGDLEVLVVDAMGDGDAFVRRLTASDVDAQTVPEAGAGAAAAMSDVVLLEATASGPSGFLAVAGSRGAAAVARHAGVPVWVVIGTGRALPGRLWDALRARLDDESPWDADVELVPLDLADVVVGPTGSDTPEQVVRRADCPAAPELLC